MKGALSEKLQPVDSGVDARINRLSASKDDAAIAR